MPKLVKASLWLVVVCSVLLFFMGVYLSRQPIFRPVLRAMIMPDGTVVFQQKANNAVPLIYGGAIGLTGAGVSLLVGGWKRAGKV